LFAHNGRSILDCVCVCVCVCVLSQRCNIKVRG